MPSPALLRYPTGQDLFVCTICALRAAKPANLVFRRWIGMKYLAKIADAEEKWQEKATRIRSGKEKSMLSILEERGLINQLAGSRELVDINLTSRRVGAYVGVDPTAPSLHLGNLVPLMSLFWMYLKGYHTVSLLGGATAKIGDPTDRLKSRKKEPPTIRTANMASMHLQLKKLWLNVEAYGRKYGFERTWAHHRELINNNAWWNKLPMLELLQTLGPGMRMGSMLARDTVKNKIRYGDGMSYAEFSYPLMQAWDWWYLYHSKGIQTQIGGSDQFGNITAGIDAIKYIIATHPDPAFRSMAKEVGEPFGFTVPLLTTASGEKFGKSAGNAIWLDGEKTTAFELYGYMLRTPDADVSKFLKMFTFLPLLEIEALVQEHAKSACDRKAQHKLASEFVELVHGSHEAISAETQHRLLFKKGPGLVLQARADPQAMAGITTVNNRPAINIKLPESLIYQRMFGRVLLAIEFVNSLSAAQRLVQGNGLYIGKQINGKTASELSGLAWSKIKSLEAQALKQYLMHGDLLLFRKGKHNVRVIQVVTDEEYVLSGDEYPGMDPEWKQNVLDAIDAKNSGIQAEKKSFKEIGMINELIEEDKSA